MNLIERTARRDVIQGLIAVGVFIGFLVVVALMI